MTSSTTIRTVIVLLLVLANVMWSVIYDLWFGCINACNCRQSVISLYMLETDPVLNMWHNCLNLRNLFFYESAIPGQVSGVTGALSMGNKYMRLTGHSCPSLILKEKVTQKQPCLTMYLSVISDTWWNWWLRAVVGKYANSNPPLGKGSTCKVD